MELLGLHDSRFPDGSTHAPSRGRTWLAFVAFAASALLFGCNALNHPPQDESTNDTIPNGTGECVPGHAGCPCDTPGAVASCGTLTSHVGDYVTCQMGEATCSGGVWGACAGDREIVTKSLAPLSNPSGIHLLTQTTSACGGSDACDPGCYWTTSSSTDVSAPGLGASPENSSAVTLVSTECTGLQCQIPSNCADGSPTQLTGVVTDPSGQNPVYNAVVYIPLDPSGTLPSFSSGASCDSCAGTGTIQAVALTTTAADGTFTLTNVPSTGVAPNAPIPLVVQTGKWRREQLLTSVPQCVSTPVDPSLSRLPRTHTDGNNDQADLPKIAIVMASQDALECLLLKVGVDVGEFQPVPPATGTPADAGAPSPNRVDLYQGEGNNVPGFVGQSIASETQLEGSLSTLEGYDAVLLPCEGGNSELDPTRLGYASTVADYANAGGRIFTTHRSISWLAMTGNTGIASPINPQSMEANPFYSTVNWNISTRGGTFASIQASIDTTLAGVTDEAGAPVPSPEGEAFAAWMGDVGAGSPLVTIAESAVDVTSVNPPTTEWMRATNAPNGDNGPISFSFDTPVVNSIGDDGGVVTADGGAGSCGRVFFNDFHVAATDRFPMNAGSSCVTNSDCGYTATCTPATPQPGVCMPTATCTSDADCNAGFTCGIGTDNVCGVGCQSAMDCPAGESCTNDRCVGCFIGPDCASGNCQGAQMPVCSATSTDFPLECQQGQPLTPQEKALEFMLFDLTSCVVPAAFTVQPVKYEPATFTETFTAAMQCQPGETVRWRELDWNATIPGDSSISFSVQTGDPAADGGPIAWTPSTPALLAKATTSTFNIVTAEDAGPDADTDASVIVSPEWDVAFIDTGMNSDGGPTSVLNSQSELLLTVTLTPSTDQQQAPTLNEWRITSVCTPSE